MHRLHKTSTSVKVAFSNLPGTQTNLYETQMTSTVVKTAFRNHVLKQAATRPPWPSKRVRGPSRHISRLAQASQPVKMALSNVHGTYTDMYQDQMTSTVVKTAFRDLKYALTGLFQLQKTSMVVNSVQRYSVHPTTINQAFNSHGGMPRWLFILIIAWQEEMDVRGGVITEVATR